MRRIAGRMFLAVVIAAITVGAGGCGSEDGEVRVGTMGQSLVLEDVECDTDDPNNDGIIEPPEVTKPDIDLTLKRTCSDPIRIEMEVCLTEIVDGELRVLPDLSGNEPCAVRTHNVACVNTKFQSPQSRCTGGNLAYCDFAVPRGMRVVECGWKTRKLEVFNARTNTLIEYWTEDALDEIIFDPPLMGDQDAL